MSTNETVRDLAFVLRLTAAQAMVVPSDVETATGGKFNTRYARELLALGTDKGLLVLTEDPDLGDVWTLQDETEQVLVRASDGERYFVESEWLVAEALGVALGRVADAVEKAQADKDKPRRSTRTVDKGDLRKCTCGCGENVAGKSLYRPGHDARHAGQIAREVAADLLNDAAYDHRMALEVLPTSALRMKALAHAERIVAKATKKVKAQPEAQPEPEPQVFTGNVKIGRWVYSVRSHGGDPEYLKQGGWLPLPAEHEAKVEWNPAV